MTRLPSDDRQWQDFLRQHCPEPPAAKADLEEQLMRAIEKSPPPELNQRFWAPAIVAGLLMVWSSYRALVFLPEPSNSANLEIFLENSWNGVVGEASTKTYSNTTEEDWVLLANTTQ
ncbi:MAG: hypothetical protein F6J86_25450 [Symploca sp. SIO1B1]|nr:hypothetical protein [Symploca sp. SIO1C2]NER97153.1 hypothetical protein [Symploca sp. SIO1B1]